MPATGNTGAEVDQQKMALLTAIAQQGSQGQQAFQAEAARRAAAQQAAVASVAGQSKMTGAAGAAPKAFTQQLQAKTAAQGDVYAQDAAMSNNAFNNSIAQTSASNAAYMDQAKAAVPVVQAQTAGLVAQIRAEQEAAKAERDYQIEQRRIEAEQAALDRPLEQQERELRQKEIELALKELEGEGGLSEEEIGSRQARVLESSATANPVVRDTLDKLTQFENFDLAVAAAPQLIDEIIKAYQVDEEGKPVADKKVWGAKDRTELYRRLYEYFNPAELGKVKDDPTELGNRYISQGVDPRPFLPGYVPANKEGPKTIEKRGPAVTRRNPRYQGRYDMSELAKRIAEMRGTNANFQGGNTGSYPSGGRGYSPGGS